MSSAARGLQILSLMLLAVFVAVGYESYWLACFSAAILALSVSAGAPFRQAGWNLPKSIEYFGYGAISLLAMLLGPASLGDPVSTFENSSALHKPFYIIAIFLLYACAFRMFLKNPIGGTKVTIAFGFGVLLSAASVLSGAMLHVVCLMYMLLSAFVLRVEDPTRLQVEKWEKGAYSSLASIALISILSAASLVAVIPILEQEISSYLIKWTTQSKIGFEPGPFTLGRLEGALQSRKVSLTIEGPCPKYMRGEVYNVYSRSGWKSRVQKTNGHWVPTELEDCACQVVNHISGSRNLFVPLDVSSLALANFYIEQQRAVGLFNTKANITGHVYGFSFGLETGLKQARVSEDSSNLQLPSRWKSQLVKIAKEWTKGIYDPSAQLKYLERHLSENFEYSLNFTRENHEEPVLDFLLYSKKGHCEYFASAMTLLARSLGIHARLVSGFCVQEFNSYGSFHVAREQDAHAWVEASADGVNWMTYDPTPRSRIDMLSLNQTSSLEQWLDAVAFWMGKFVLEVTLVCLACVLLIFQIFRKRKVRVAKVKGDFAHIPKACAEIQALLVGLEDSKQIHRKLSSTVSNIIIQIQSSTADSQTALLLQEIVDLLNCYEGLRYQSTDSNFSLPKDVANRIVAITQKLKDEVKV